MIKVHGKRAIIAILTEPSTPYEYKEIPNPRDMTRKFNRYLYRYKSYVNRRRK
tara:strand:- start:185 stop:343 length:159 start_codon:yes stop_codon:yes gene_type:complete